LHYGPFKGTMKKTNRGALISSTPGLVTPFALKDLEKFGTLFIVPG